MRRVLRPHPTQLILRLAPEPEPLAVTPPVEPAAPVRPPVRPPRPELKPEPTTTPEQPVENPTRPNPGPSLTLTPSPGSESQTLAAIRELSTPVIEIWPGVLCAPIVGVLDSGRAAEMTSALLSNVVATKAALAIIDITGIEAMDTQATDHFLRMARAVKLHLPLPLDRHLRQRHDGGREDQENRRDDEQLDKGET